MSSTRSANPLHELVLATELAQPGEVLMVFDLDSTLFDLSQRVRAILTDFAAHPQNQQSFPEACALLQNVEIRRQDWGLKEPLARLGLDTTTHKEFVSQVQSAWAKGFFSNHYLEHDRPLRGAVEFVKHLHARGAQIMYLTGRDVPRMGEGTIKSLVHHGFPHSMERTDLILKSTAHLDDAEFKAEILMARAPHHQRLVLFENEPVNLQRVEQSLPQIDLVWIDTCHSGTIEPAAHWIRIEDFDGPWRRNS
jgi:hypothetical protein